MVVVYVDGTVTDDDVDVTGLLDGSVAFAVAVLVTDPLSTSAGVTT
jgi:hypothetical protein